LGISFDFIAYILFLFLIESKKRFSSVLTGFRKMLTSQIITLIYS